MSIGLEDYKFQEKEKWRHWVWGNAFERLNPFNSVVLYLAGAQDLDRQVALQYGFQDYNLIAVENDKKSIKELRKKGVNVIEGNIIDVISCWEGKPKIDFVNFDFTNGLNWDKIRLVCPVLLSNIFPSIRCFVFNIMRGRDKFAGDMRKEKAYIFNRQYRKFVLKKINLEKSFIESKFKHRGILLLFWLSICSFKLIEGIRVDKRDLKSLLGYSRIFNPKIYSYKNENNTVFDCLYININWGNNILLHNVDDLSNLKLKEKNKLKSRIAAAKAIRTMKIKETNNGENKT